MQFVSRTVIVLLAAFSLASCAMTTEMQPASLATKLALQPTVTQLADGERYTWEFTVEGTFEKMQHDMTDSLLIIVDQVKAIASK